MLADRIYRGMGVAGRRLGSPYAVYRPATTLPPLSSRNRIIKLCAGFSAGGADFKSGATYSDAFWQGVYDASYTQAGDYLVGDGGTFFVAFQAPLLPVQCIRTNCVVSIFRPAQVTTGGYTGMVIESAAIIDQSWPARAVSGSARISGSLPETRFGNWTILLPVSLPGAPQCGDIMTDDLGRNLVVAAAEQSELGWRLMAKQAAG